MDSGLAAIIGAAVGAIGGGGVQWWITNRDFNDRRQQRKRAILETALHNVQRERRLLHTGYSMWRHGAQIERAEVLDNDRAVSGAVEEVWISESQVMVEYGEESPQWKIYQQLIDSMLSLKWIYDRNDDAGVTPSPTTEHRWDEASRAVGRAQRDFVRVIRGT
jgi:hypothetical protein